jgi:hypothetical protein
MSPVWLQDEQSIVVLGGGKSQLVHKGGHVRKFTLTYPLSLTDQSTLFIKARAIRHNTEQEEIWPRQIFIVDLDLPAQCPLTDQPKPRFKYVDALK